MEETKREENNLENSNKSIRGASDKVVNKLSNTNVIDVLESIKEQENKPQLNKDLKLWNSLNPKSINISRLMPSSKWVNKVTNKDTSKLLQNYLSKHPIGRHLYKKKIAFIILKLLSLLDQVVSLQRCTTQN